MCCCPIELVCGVYSGTKSLIPSRKSLLHSAAAACCLAADKAAASDRSAFETFMDTMSHRFSSNQPDTKACYIRLLHSIVRATQFETVAPACCACSRGITGFDQRSQPEFERAVCEQELLRQTARHCMYSICTPQILYVGVHIYNIT